MYAIRSYYVVERIYSLTCFALTAWLVVLIWKEITGSLLYGWFVITSYSIHYTKLYDLASREQFGFIQKFAEQLIH